MDDLTKSVVESEKWPPEWCAVEKNKYVVKFVETGGWYSADCMWDGCIHFNRYHNLPLDPDVNYGDDDGTEPVDYIHYCDIDEEIDRLQRLKRAAQAWFNGVNASDEFWADKDMEV